MSRYSDKHASTTPCSHPSCESPGTKLVLLGSKPGWVCVTHYQWVQGAVRSS